MSPSRPPPSGTGGETLSADPLAPRGERCLPRPGEVIGGKYQVEGMIGRGGMGVVLAARHLALERPVAVKLLDRSVETGTLAVERFLREGRAAAMLHSRHIVRVFDVGTLPDGSALVVMERLEGEDLAALLKREGPLALETAADYLLQACAGLAEAHERRIVHRDLKPSNLFLTTEHGRPLVKVLDFGIAKLAQASDRDAALTATSGLLGSPAYMAPEQIRTARDVDARADVWSLGVVLFELVTGSLPFGGATASAMLASIAADPPALLRSRLPDAPGALERLISRCLEKDRTKRPRDAAELGSALLQFSTRPADSTLAALTKAESPSARPAKTLAAASVLATVVLGAVFLVRPRAPAELRAGARVAAALVSRAHGKESTRLVSKPASPAPAPPLAPPQSVTKPKVARKPPPASSNRDLDTATAERK